MANTDNTPTLAMLAMQYGTITNDQYRHLTKLFTLKQKEKEPPDYATLLLSQKFATQYQVGLLKLIQEYHFIKRQGEEFGRIVVEKGFATQEDVDKALEHQRKEFRRARIKKLIGDILVESRVITLKQRNQILKEQSLLERRVDKIYSEARKESKAETVKREADLSDYEKQFLQIKTLDREFAASVIEKGLASERDVTLAQKVQEEQFDTGHPVRILGDIMVSMSVLTEDQKKIVLTEQNRYQDEVPHEGLHVEISKDKTEAKIRMDADKKAHISLSTLKQVLESKGITNGVYPDPLLQGHLERGSKEFAVAKTDHSKQILGSAKILIDSTERKEKRKGELLVKLPIQTGAYAKTDVFGRVTPRSKGTDFSFRSGSGSRISKDGSAIIAAKTGIPALSIERKIFVHPIIHVLEDADLRYGPLEAYAELTVSGVITGAYPVTAGNIKAREIRGANIRSMGNIHSDVGITDSIIRTQGDVHARYLHNCRIECFGNVYIQNEIIDSTILCSGKLDAPNCRTISTTIHAKKGIALAGVGSERTRPCTIGAGTEYHVLETVSAIEQEISLATQSLDALKETKAEKEKQIQKIFQKMVELKLFHDRAKKKKKMLEIEFKKTNQKSKNDNLKNLLKLIKNFDSRMENTINVLKKKNAEKKIFGKEKTILQKKIESLTPKIGKQVLTLQQDIVSFYEWARSQKNIPEIIITGRTFQGTELKAMHSSKVLDSDMDDLVSTEVWDADASNYTLKISGTPLP